MNYKDHLFRPRKTQHEALKGTRIDFKNVLRYNIPNVDILSYNPPDPVLISLVVICLLFIPCIQRAESPISDSGIIQQTITMKNYNFKNEVDTYNSIGEPSSLYSIPVKLRMMICYD